MEDLDSPICFSFIILWCPTSVASGKLTLYIHKKMRIEREVKIWCYYKLTSQNSFCKRVSDSEVARLHFENYCFGIQFHGGVKSPRVKRCVWRPLRT
jgi:hypothetical protein